jgi:hypothetical protein
MFLSSKCDLAVENSAKKRLMKVLKSVDFTKRQCYNVKDVTASKENEYY